VLHIGRLARLGRRRPRRRADEGAQRDPRHMKLSQIDTESVPPTAGVGTEGHAATGCWRVAADGKTLSRSSVMGDGFFIVRGATHEDSARAALDRRELQNLCAALSRRASTQGCIAVRMFGVVPARAGNRRRPTAQHLSPLGRRRTWRKPTGSRALERAPGCRHLAGVPSDQGQHCIARPSTTCGSKSLLDT